MRCSIRFLAIAVLGALTACYEDDGGAHGRAAAMKALASKSYRQDGGGCDDAGECARKEAGFAFAKRALRTDPDDCPANGEPDFIDGCQRYGDDIEAAIKAARKHF